VTDPGSDWLSLMRNGDFAAAWKVSDSILAQPAGAPSWHLPRHQRWVWDGRPLEGRKVTIACFRGLGDTLMFIRYVPLVRAIASEVIVYAQASLIPLLRSIPLLPSIGAVEYRPLTDDEPEELTVELMELPHVFRTTLDTVPRDVPYLHAEPAAMSRDPGDRRLHVGIVWRSGDWDPRRDIPRERMESIAGPGVVLHPLQKENVDTPLATARIMRTLDLVATIDSMTAHLAGALGVPVWTLLHADPDWRWMLGRDDSPWYPTMRLFRQAEAGEWEPVLTDVGQRLLRYNAGLNARRNARQEMDGNT
jgi:hypothetical protein